MDKKTRWDWVNSLKIGSEVWVSDNFTRYTNKFVKKTIVDETNRSWMVEGWIGAPKYSKKTGDGLCTENEVNDKMFVDSEKYKISERVRRITDADKLRRILAILDKDDN